ncbi:MAG: hypothetical protein ACM3UZ_10725 [Acidobacteriota bacterium]
MSKEFGYDEMLEALKVIDDNGGDEVRYDKLANIYGDGNKALDMFLYLEKMGYIRRSGLPSGPPIAASLTPEGKSIIGK